MDTILSVALLYYACLIVGFCVYIYFIYIYHGKSQLQYTVAGLGGKKVSAGLSYSSINTVSTVAAGEVPGQPDCPIDQRYLQRKPMLVVAVWVPS